MLSATRGFHQIALPSKEALARLRLEIIYIKGRKMTADTMESVATTAAHNRDSARVRLTLDLSTRLNEAVEQLARDEGSSKADILRFAVEFLTAAKKAKEAGMHVGAWIEPPNGTRIEREFIGI